ncbi:MAG: PEGA domain-containing protein, partial [Gammaproteobacteria bacterium]|nr:PEGA domain-containing protein [Gammaproteobacteria bacterium]
MRYNIKIVHFSLVPLLFFFSGSATADTYPFSVNPTFGDRDIFNFTVNSVGTINGEATWTGSAANLALILNGPGQVGYYARKDGSSPLSLSYTVTTADLSKGTDWRLSIVNFGGGDATGTVTIAYPIEPTYLYIYIDIDSTPQGAQIWIDGVNSGELTPSTQYFDRPGEHTIELILNGYQLYQDSFDSSKSMKLKVNLTPIVKPTPTPSFYFIDSTPRGAQIWIDGVNSGELTPFIKYFDKPGEHTIELILNGYQ